MSVNKVILVGHLGQDPQVKVLPSGGKVANFSVATNEKWTAKDGTKQEKTEWTRITVWGKLAEICEQYLRKGRLVYVEGRLETTKWQDKEGKDRFTTGVQAQVVQFLGSSGQSQEQHDSPPPAQSQAKPGFEPPSTYNNETDDIPF